MSSNEIDELLPEEGYVSADLNFQDNDECLPQRAIDQRVFVEWLTEGQHDCDVARTLGVAWSRDLCGTTDESPGNFFKSLLHDYTEEMAATETVGVLEAADVPDALPISWLASFVHATCSPFSFNLGADSADDVATALSRKIAEEIQAVQAYARARSTQLASCLQVLPKTYRNQEGSTWKRPSIPGRESRSNRRLSWPTGASPRHFL